LLNLCVTTARYVYLYVAGANVGPCDYCDLLKHTCSHMGISGNEKADTAAKSAQFSLHVTSMKIPATDLIPCVTKLISENWQQFWKSCTGNKLQAIRPTVGGHQQKSSLSRQDEVVINRLRIGHTRCTHSYLLSVSTHCQTHPC